MNQLEKCGVKRRIFQMIQVLTLLQIYFIPRELYLPMANDAMTNDQLDFRITLLNNNQNWSLPVGRVSGHWELVI
jgi:hypothetical protein